MTLSHLRQLQSAATKGRKFLKVGESVLHEWEIGGERRPLLFGTYAGDWPMEKQNADLELVVAALNNLEALLAIAQAAEDVEQYIGTSGAGTGDASRAYKRLRLALSALNQ